MLFKFKLRNSYSGICMKRKLVFFPNLLVLVACGKSGSSDRDLDKTLAFLQNMKHQFQTTKSQVKEINTFKN